jgi:hypothetical protein
MGEGRRHTTFRPRRRTNHSRSWGKDRRTRSIVLPALRTIPAHGGRTVSASSGSSTEPSPLMGEGRAWSFWLRSTSPNHPRSWGKDAGSGGLGLGGERTIPAHGGRTWGCHHAPTRGGRTIPAHGGRTSMSGAWTSAMTEPSPLMGEGRFPTWGRTCEPSPLMGEGLPATPRAILSLANHPRSWGKDASVDHTLLLQVRTIPAHGGRTRDHRASCAPPANHPRSWGKDCARSLRCLEPFSNHPRSWGKDVARLTWNSCARRTIPAHGGRTPATPFARPGHPNHPRSWGKDAPRLRLLPPRRRTIPAHGGRTGPFLCLAPSADEPSPLMGEGPFVIIEFSKTSEPQVVRLG